MASWWHLIKYFGNSLPCDCLRFGVGIPIFFQLCIHTDVTEALVISVVLSMCALILHTAFFHDSTGVGIIYVVTGFQTVHAHFVKKIIHHRL